MPVPVTGTFCKVPVPAPSSLGSGYRHYLKRACAGNRHRNLQKMVQVPVTGNFPKVPVQLAVNSKVTVPVTVTCTFHKVPVPMPVVVVVSPIGGSAGSRTGRSQSAIKQVIGTFGPIFGTFLRGHDTYIRQKITSDQGIDRYYGVLCWYTDKLISKSYLVLKSKLNTDKMGEN